MPIDMPAYLLQMRTFLANRANFPVEELAKYEGQWVAFCPDGSRVAASARYPEQLEDLLKAAGLDPLQCVIEGIPGDEPCFDSVDGSAA